MAQCQPDYNRISERVLCLLTQLSDHVKAMGCLNNELLQDPCLAGNACFRKYMGNFDKAGVLSFRCMGFMECLVLTKCYSVQSLCRWKNELFMPSYHCFCQAVNALSQVRVPCNPMFTKLLCEAEEVKKVYMQIMQTTQLYNLPC